jgi:hypothetical protein
MAEETFGIADLFEIAKLLFGETAAVSYGGGAHRFFSDRKRQWVVLCAMKDFQKYDPFFKAMGDTITPSYTGYGIGHVLKAVGRLMKPSKLEDRIRSNPILRRGINEAYTPWWYSPEQFVQ